MLCIEYNESCLGCGCVLSNLSGAWHGRGSVVGGQQALGRALCWQQEAGLCSWLCAKGASQAMGTALPGQGCKCQVKAVPLPM